MQLPLLPSLRKSLIAVLFVPLSLGMFSPFSTPPGASRSSLDLPMLAAPYPIDTLSATPEIPLQNPPARKAPVKSPAPAPRPHTPLHTYPAYGLTEDALIEQTYLTAVYFVPKDQQGGAYTFWHENVTTTLEAIKGYMAREFDNRLTISYTVYPKLLIGDHDLIEYGELDSNKISMRQEVEAKIGWPAIKKAEQDNGRYPTLLIYYHSGYNERYQAPNTRLGGAYALLQTALLPAFHLENEMIHGPRQAGLIASTHEFAHLLGVPHPWEMEPALEDAPWNLMGYMAYGTLMETHIADQVKEVMGWLP